MNENYAGLTVNPGGWLHERIDRLRNPQIKRGALGSAHYCTQREYKRFRREDSEGLILLGAFWDGDKKRLDLGTGKFFLNSYVMLWNVPASAGRR